MITSTALGKRFPLTSRPAPAEYTLHTSFPVHHENVTAQLPLNEPGGLMEVVRGALLAVLSSVVPVSNLSP